MNSLISDSIWSKISAGERGIPDSIKERYSPPSYDVSEFSKLLIEIDNFLQNYYDLSEEELDFIINKDINFQIS